MPSSDSVCNGESSKEHASHLTPYTSHLTRETQSNITHNVAALQLTDCSDACTPWRALKSTCVLLSVAAAALTITPWPALLRWGGEGGGINRDR